MSEEGRLFLEACGASGPLRFEWADPTTSEVRSRDVEKPVLVVGHDPAADLVLDDPSVEPYQAFLQVIDGRLFAFDLGNTSGLRWGEIPRAAGWVNRGQPIRIGRHTIRLVGGDREGGESIVEPAPTSSRYVSRLSLPGVALEFRVAGAGKPSGARRDVLDHVLVLGGRSERCRIQFEGPHAAKFTCTLIRTPKGLWMTNVLPTEGATVNGSFCRFVRLEDDDVVQLGHINMRIMYNATAKPSLVRPSSGRATLSLEPANPPRAIRGMVQPSDESSLEALLPMSLEEAGNELGVPSSPFGHALVLMVRLLGDVHRDHLTLVRDELAEIRRLSRDMEKLRGEMRQPVEQRLSLSHTDSSNGASHVADLGPEVEDAPRPNPGAVQEIISERLEAWERERQSRWRKLLRLLTQS
jgi:hypothetical protein